MIQINAPTAALIGDGLVHVPYLAWLCEKHKSRARIAGMNTAVADALGPSYPFEFGPLRPGPLILVNLLDCLHQGFNGCHMAQSFFAQYGDPAPSLPITLDLKDEPCFLPPGLVIAPFSRTNSADNNKFWPHDRWLEVIQTLRGAGMADRVYVIGNSQHDDPSPYRGHGIDLFFDHPLSRVLNLLRQAPLFMSVEGGMSHLAHFGGVYRHVLLYPAKLTPLCWAQNPRGYMVKADPKPINVPVAEVVNAARQVLRA